MTVILEWIWHFSIFQNIQSKFFQIAIFDICENHIIAEKYIHNWSLNDSATKNHFSSKNLTKVKKRFLYLRICTFLGLLFFLISSYKKTFAGQKIFVKNSDTIILSFNLFMCSFFGKKMYYFRQFVNMLWTIIIHKISVLFCSVKVRQ